MVDPQSWEVELPGMPVPPPRQDENSERSGQVVTNSDLQLSDRDVARFNRKIVYSPGCWFWVGSISTPDGYGRFTWQRGNEQRTMLAHRFALMIAGVVLGDSVIAEHACNEPLCVRVDPAHVHPSTQTRNIEYAVRTGRLGGPYLMVGSDQRAKRSRRIRDALASGWDEKGYRNAISQDDGAQLPLF